MSLASAQQDVQVGVGKDFVIMGGDRIGVSPDGKNVTAYTNGGVETKVATGADIQQAGMHISADFNRVVLNGVSIERAADGHLIISTTGTVITKPTLANDTDVRPEIGTIERDGDHKGKIYGGIWPKEYGGDNKPIWFSAAPNLMNNFDAVAWAEGQGGSLPTRQPGNYLTTLKGKGGPLTDIFNRGHSKGGWFMEMFNRGGPGPAGYIWSGQRDSYGRGCAWSQRLSDGEMVGDFLFHGLSVLACFR